MEDKFKLNRQLQQVYKKNEFFKRKMDERDKCYNMGKIALERHEDLGISEEILQIFAFEKQYQVFFYYGYMQPKSKNMTLKLTLFLIKNFKAQSSKKYKFVFFNNCVQSNQIFYEFKNIFLTLPINYFLALDQFIFVQPSFSQKVNQWWTNDEVEKYFKAKTRYVSNTEELCAILGTDVSKLTGMLPLQIIQEEFPQIAKTIELKEKSFSEYRINVQGQQRSEKQRNQFKSFLLDISNFLTKSNNQPLQIDDYESNEASLPLILEELFGYFDENPQKVKEEGLFRKCVSVDDENQTLQELMRSNFQCLKQVKSPHLVASLIKRFFAKLKTPIYPFPLFYNMMHDQGVSDKLRLVKEQTALLPQKNFFCLLFLFQFLVQKILPMEKYTKMDTRNLAICFAPCLLWSEKASELDLLYATKSSHAIRLILDNFDEVFGTKAERQEKIRSTVETSRGKWELDLTEQIKSLSGDQSLSDR